MISLLGIKVVLDQVDLALNNSYLTQHIESGFEEKNITGVTYIGLTVAYDTVNHNLLSKLQKQTSDSKLVKTIETILRNRRYFVTHGEKNSR